METYRAQHFALQKIGEEAIINLEKFPKQHPKH